MALNPKRFEKPKIKTRLKVDDEVIVISGKNKSAKGKVLAIDLKKGRVIVKGVNLRKRYARPTQENPKGGELQIEHPIAISNVMPYDSKSKERSKIRVELNKNGERVRVYAKSGKEIGG